MLSHCMGDVWVILDCCVATSAAIRTSELEFLVASAFESMAFSHIPTSFSARLTDLLKAAAGSEMTVAQLPSQLVAEAASPYTFLDYIPVNIAPATKFSAVLRPLYKMAHELHNFKKGDAEADGKVLISVCLQGKHSIPVYQQWERWLANDISDGITKIKIQAVFDSSFFTYCLLTVPVEVWDMIRDHDAYSFVQFVDSDNKFLQQNLHFQSAATSQSDIPGPGRGFSRNIPHHPYSAKKENK